MSLSLAAIGLNLLMIAYTSWLLARAGVSRPTWLAGASIAVVWQVLLTGLLSGSSPLPEQTSGVVFFAAVLGFVGLVGGVLWLFRRDLLGLSQRDLLLPQGIRVYFGAGFLVQAALGHLPLGFGVMDGLTHITAGFLGLLAANTMTDRATPLSWAANLFGLADILVVASTLAFVLLPELGLRHPMMFAVFLPAPVWLWLHVIAVYKAVGAPSGALALSTADDEGAAVG